MKLRRNCCHGSSEDDCDGTCTDNTPCTRPKPLTIPQIREQIEYHRHAIGKHRDALRALRSDLSSLLESVDEGCQNLDSAIDRLSEFA